MYVICESKKTNKDEKSALKTNEAKPATNVFFDFWRSDRERALKSDEGFIEYVKTNGYHFNEKLAEHVSRMFLQNTMLQYFSKNQLDDLIESMKISFGNKITKGDIIYAFNIVYARFYPELLKDTKSCMMLVYKDINFNNYDGMIFCRWLSDAIGRGVKIDWKNFV